MHREILLLIASGSSSASWRSSSCSWPSWNRWTLPRECFFFFFCARCCEIFLAEWLLLFKSWQFFFCCVCMCLSVVVVFQVVEMLLPLVLWEMLFGTDVLWFVLPRPDHRSAVFHHHEATRTNTTARPPLPQPPPPPYLSIPNYGAMIKRPMDLQSMYYKVQYGAFGGLDPSAVADSAPPSEQGEADVLVDPTAISAANSDFGIQLPNGDPNASGLLHGGAGAVSAHAGAMDAGDDDDSAVIDGFFSSDAVASGGSDGPAAPAPVGAAPHAHDGSNGGEHQVGGANGGPQLYSKEAGSESGLPGLINPGAPLDLVNGGLCAGGDGGDRMSFADEAGRDAGQVSRGGVDGAVVVSPLAPGGGNVAEVDRAEEQGMPVVATSVPFATATAPFDHVSFFRDMKLVSHWAIWTVYARSCCWRADLDCCASLDL